MNSKRWQDHFSEQYKALEQSYGVEESGVSMLAYAIEKQIIPESVYIEWALQTFEIPLLKISYFADHPASTQIWEKYRSAFAWNLDCLPMTEWEGHLFVACLEPIEFPVEMNVIPLLCPLSGLRQLWQKYQSSMSFEIPDNLSEIAQVEAVGEETLDLETPAEEQLEGLLSSAVPVVLEKTGVILESQLENTQIVVNLEKTSTEIKVDATAKVEASVSEAPAKAKTPTPAAVKPVTLPLIKSSGPISVTVAENLEDYFLGAIASGNPQKFKSDCAALFAKLNKYFPKSVLLGTNLQLQSLKVVAWDQNTTANKQALPIDLQTASIFRIVESTQKPFHGPISSNDINIRFFSDWNDQIVPENVTIVPILMDDKVVAMILSTGDVSNYTRTILQISEKISEEFSLTLATKLAAA